MAPAIEDWILAHPGVSHAGFGAIGGLVYLAVIYTAGYRIRAGELFTRPFLGAVAAVALTEMLHLPNHLTSLGAGMVGLQIIGAIVTASERAFGVMKNNPGLVAMRLMHREDISQAIMERTDALERGGGSDQATNNGRGNE